MEEVIVEDGLALVDKVGPGQYTLVVIEALKQLGYNVIVPKKDFLAKIKNKNIRRVMYLIWLNTLFFLKLLLLKKNTPIIYTNYSVPFIKVYKVKTLPVIHDLCSYLFPQTMTKIQNFYSIIATNNAIKNADKIITVSKTVKEEIEEQFKVSSGDIYVVYNSNTLNMKSFKENIIEDTFKKFDIQRQQYIVAVSTFNRRKNIMELIEAFNMLSKENVELKMVLVGRSGNDETINAIQAKNKNIVFTGYLSNQELDVIYKNALVFISPSLYEGFGIPIIDAQKYGVPVICSDIPVYREIAGQSAEKCLPQRNGFYESLKKILASSEYRNELINNGYKNIAKYSIDIVKSQLEVLLKNA